MKPSRIALLASLVLTALTAAAGAGLTFANPKVEAHAAADAEKVEASFLFQNTGSEPVTISRYESGCSCLGVTVRDGKMAYAPGEKGELRAIFEIGNFRGEVDKPIQLWLKGDTEENPSVTLNVKVFVPVLVELEPKVLRWRIGDPQQPQSFHLKVLNKEPIRVVSASGGNDRYDLKLITIKEGESYEVQVTPRNLTEPGIGTFQILTDSKIPRHRTLQGFAVVAEPDRAPAAK
jgi:hypothetical protein